ncbi:MAG TPA: vWA domain-containing protein, partial [Candidatus Paceibacterota bacterium]|nr:vWA domain-containing protein [Candidatus Paceibacterota bacterium]
TTNSSKFEIQPITNSDHNPAKKNETPVNSGSDNFSPVESTTYAGWATDANGFQGLCYKSIQVKESLGECADTVMMLDRTGSMTSTDLSDEKAAANSLVNLYAGVVPHPELGIGHFGDIATGLSAEIIAHLSNDYTNFASVINNGLPSKPTSYTNISAAIDSAQNELTSMSDGKKKVLILISDGGANVPCPGKTPCGGNTNPTATTAATDSANTAKDAGTEIYTIHYGSAGAGGTHADQDFLASLATDSANDHFEPENDTIGFSSPTHYAQNATGDTWSNGVGAEANGGTAAADTAGHMERYYGFGFNNIPSDANIQGIEINTDAWASGNSASLGPRTGSSFTNNNSAGAVDWINPNPAQNNVTLGKNQTSHYLKATNFGFSIPANAVIRGISVNMTRSAQYNSGGFFGSNNLSDNSVRLVKGNTITGSDKAGNQAWSTSNTPASYGSPSDLWNTAWTPSDINSSNFGLVFSVKRNGSSNSTNKATITAISMTVYYTLPINAACQLGVDLSWSNGNSGSWTTQKTEVIGGTEQTYTFGGATDQWGQDGAWASQDFSDANFRVRVQDIDPDPGSNTNCTDGAATNLDWIQAKVYYSIPGNVANADKENSDGDHFFISPTSADMSEVFDTVANLACPALSDPGAPKDPPPPPSPPPPPPPIDISSWNEVIN